MGVLNIDSTSEILPLGRIAVIKNIEHPYALCRTNYGIYRSALLECLRGLRDTWSVSVLRDMVISFFTKRFENAGSGNEVHGADIWIYNIPWLCSECRDGYIPAHQHINVNIFCKSGVYEWSFYIVGAKPIIINLENNCHHMVHVTDQSNETIKYYGHRYKEATIEEVCGKFGFDSAETAIRAYMRSVWKDTQDPDDRTAG